MRGTHCCIYDTNAAATKRLVARGAKLAKSAAEVASMAKIVLVSLPTPLIVNEVALGATGIIKGTKVRTYGGWSAG